MERQAGTLQWKIGAIKFPFGGKQKSYKPQDSTVADLFFFKKDDTTACLPSVLSLVRTNMR